MTLSAENFADFFRAIHDRDPFPWQIRLCRQVLTSGDEGGWPDILAVPTGCGKTSTLDIALFALAAQPTRFPRRIVMVIDRRVVVDQGARHAEHIAQRLQTTTDPVAQQVAAALRQLWNGNDQLPPIETTVLRGGMPRDDAWAHRPDRPVLALSTVDQVGSRLLFRGYGVSERMASVHAGLLGHDTLFLLDEVHLSVPFAETLLALRERWRGFWPNTLPDRWGVVRLSATPGMQRDSDRLFELKPGGDDDHDSRLEPRLYASKPARCEVVTVSGRDEDKKRSAFAKQCSEAAATFLKPQALDAPLAPRTLGVIVNRVATAREIAANLAVAFAETADVRLLTGRMRPLDREALVAETEPRVRAGRDRSAGTRPLVVVATQCIEAGADFDFDALITECASLDALRQRFGRLDRLGDRHSAGGESPAVILVRSDQVADSAEPDPIYGEALRNTWRWLQTLGLPCDFGTRQLPLPDEQALAELAAPRLHAPILLPAHLDAWNQTHPRPEPDPDVALWLHGPQRGEPEVQIVWRADLNAAALARDASNDSLADWFERLSACPPAQSEALALPLSAVRRWLQGQAAEELADVPSMSWGAADERAEVGHPRAAYVWTGSQDGSSVLRPGSRNDGLKPGMVLVVPASYGGLRHGSWAPDSLEPVSDLGDLAQLTQQRPATLRLNMHSLPSALQSAALPRSKDELTQKELRDQVNEWLQAVDTAPLPPAWGALLRALGKYFKIVAHRNDEITLIARAATADSASTEDDYAGSLIGKQITLVAHSKDVWRWAEHFCVSLGLPEPLRHDVMLAAWLHDAGKADPRFQQWLAGGSAVKLAVQEPLLAKSNQTSRDWRAAERARMQAGYPQGYRHELLSVAMIQQSPQWLAAHTHDPELVLHLVGAHHGWCRPFAPLIDPDSEADFPVSLTLPDGPVGITVDLSAGTRHSLARLDSGVTDRFWTLTERYGWWGLAWLEAILRLADHRASSQGEPK